MKITKLNESLINDLNNLPHEPGMKKVSYELIKEYQNILRQYPVGTVLIHNIDAGEERFTKIEDGEYGAWEHFRAPWKVTQWINEFDMAHWLAGRSNITRSEIIQEELENMKINKLNEGLHKIYVNGELKDEIESNNPIHEVDPIAFKYKNANGTKEVRIVYADGTEWYMTPSTRRVNESNGAYYVTVYEESSTSGPEEGGYTSYGWEATHSRKFNSEDRAKQYRDEFIEGAEVTNEHDNIVEIVDEFGDRYKVAIETEESRGAANSPAKSWAQAEMGVEFDRPFFDDEGKRLPEDPKITAKRKADREALKQEYVDRVNACKTKKDVMKLLSDIKYDSLDDIDGYVSMAMDKYKSLEESKSIKTFGAKGKKLNESIRPSQELLDDCLEYYLNNAFGYASVDDYVTTEFPNHPIEFINEVSNYIKEHKHEDMNESIDSTFKVGDTFDYSGLYGGSQHCEVIKVTDDYIECKVTWTSEDDGKEVSDTSKFNLEKDSEGKQCAIVWEYHGEKGRVYPNESMNETIKEVQYGVHQFSTDSIIFRGTEEECGKYIDERKELWDDAEIYMMTPDDPHYKKDLDEASDGFEKEFYCGYVILKNRAGDGWDIYSYDGTPEKVTRAYLEDEGYATLKDAKAEIDRLHAEAEKLDESTQNSYIELDNALKYVDDLGFAGAVDVNGNKIYGDETTLRQLTNALADEYGYDVEIKGNLTEASYGGAFDIADDQYFTREDLDSFAEEVLNHINETFKSQFEVSACYIDDGILEMGVSNDEYGEYVCDQKIDMRKIKEPWHLKREYAFEVASQLITDIVQSNDGLVEAVSSSAYNFEDDNTDDLSYYYDDEELKDALTDVWEEIASKSVEDSDGFMTDYTMYRNINTGEYVFVFGDKDIYRPEDGNFDWECETEEEAKEWFDNYSGFAVEDEEWKGPSFDLFDAE